MSEESAPIIPPVEGEDPLLNLGDKDAQIIPITGLDMVEQVAAIEPVNPGGDLSKTLTDIEVPDTAKEPVEDQGTGSQNNDGQTNEADIPLISAQDDQTGEDIPRQDSQTTEQPTDQSVGRTGEPKDTGSATILEFDPNKRKTPARSGETLDNQSKDASQEDDEIFNDGDEMRPEGPIDDLIELDSKGRGHITGSKNLNGRSRNGQFLSQYEMDQIAANQDLIRDGLPFREGQEELLIDNTDSQNIEKGEHPGEVLQEATLAETQPDEVVGNGTPEQGGSPPGDGGGGGEVTPVVEELAPEIVAYNQAQEAYNIAVQQMAHGKNRLQSILAGADAREIYQNAEAQLEVAHTALIEAHANMINAQNQDLERARQANQQEMEEARNHMVELVKQRAQAEADDDHNQLETIEKEMNDIANTIADHEIYTRLFQEVDDHRQEELTAYNLNTVIELRAKVEDAMIAERTREHPRMTRVAEWIRTHRAARIGIGLGLTAAGIVGAATFNAPLVAAAGAGSAALRGYGSYNFARGIGDTIANRRMDRANIQTIEDYLKVSRAETDTVRRSKRAGAVVAAALIAAPLVGRMLDMAHHPEVIKSQTAPRTPPITTLSTPTIPKITPVDGNTLPWNFGAQFLHTNISSPDVLGKLVHNPLGIVFHGNGLSGGLGAIRSVTIPGQGTFTDLGHINGAIQAILGNK